MSKRNYKPNTLANKLRSEGVQALGSTTPTNKRTNPVFRINVPKEEYRVIWTNYDMQQCCARYYWVDLPDNIDSYNVERMLYYRACLSGFKIGGKIYILPFYIQGSLNPYGFPTRLKPLTFNGKSIPGKNDFFADGFSLPVDFDGNANDQYSAVLLYDQIPNINGQTVATRYLLNQIIINEMVEVFSRININVVISNKKIGLVVKDPKQADIVRDELAEAYSSDCPFYVISSPLDTQSLGTTSDFNSEDLFATIKNYDAVRCFMSGISSKGFGADKKERLISMEMNGVEEEKDLILDMGLELRKQFADRMNKKFGTNIKVYKRADKFKEEDIEENANEEEEEPKTIRGGIENE